MREKVKKWKRSKERKADSLVDKRSIKRSGKMKGKEIK
jgi:hypothetical protein